MIKHPLHLQDSGITYVWILNGVFGVVYFMTYGAIRPYDRAAIKAPRYVKTTTKNTVLYGMLDFLESVVHEYVLEFLVHVPTCDRTIPGHCKNERNIFKFIECFERVLFMLFMFSHRSSQCHAAAENKRTERTRENSLLLETAREGQHGFVEALARRGHK